MEGHHEYFEEESSSGNGGWVTWFCDLEGHEFFVEVSSRLHLLVWQVDEDYIRDSFNLYGLRNRVQYYT